MAATPIIEDIGEYKIDTNDYNILGKGSYGMVFPGRHSAKDEEVVGKRYLFEKDLPTDDVDKEADIMLKLPKHDNVVKGLAYVKKPTPGKYIHIWLIIEFCSLGPLGDFAKEFTLTLAQKVDLMLQSSMGVQHLHKHDLIHRDIKLDNILLTGNPDKPQVKITDFGESKFIEHINEHSVRKMTYRGTKSYMAPEFFRVTEDNRPSYNMSADNFSLGVTFLTLLDAEKGKTPLPPKGNFACWKMIIMQYFVHVFLLNLASWYCQHHSHVINNI